MKTTDGPCGSARGGPGSVCLDLLGAALSEFASDKGRPWVTGLANAAGTQTVACTDSLVLVAKALARGAARVRTKCVAQNTLQPAIVGVTTTGIHHRNSDGYIAIE